jgi:hypothetical protein
MNTERINQLATFLESIPDRKFNIRQWFSRNSDSTTGLDVPIGEEYIHCKTAACVAGWCNVMRHGGDQADWRGPGREADYLGLSLSEEDDLFTPRGYLSSNASKYYTRKRAIATLRHLAQTGIVAWQLFDQKGQRL